MSARRSVHEPRLAPPVSDRDHVRGPDDALVTLVEYGDYQCPYCGMAYPIVGALREELGDDLRFAYRHFPITTIHPFAEIAAEAAEAAGAQGRFWEMHDWIFEHQATLSPRSCGRRRAGSSSTSRGSTRTSPCAGTRSASATTS